MNTLWLSAALPIVTALLLGLVGATVAQRPVRGPSEIAMRGFAVWWVCACLVLLLVGSRTLLYIAGVRQAALYTTVSFIIALPLAVGLAGLLYYLIYIYTGKQSAIWPVAAAYSAFFAFALYYFFMGGLRTPQATPWTVQMVSDTEPPMWLGMVFGASVALPILAAVVAYASLYPRAPHGEPRFRVAAVSTAFALWFTPLLLAFVFGWNREVWFPLVYQVPGVVAAALILLSYRPPAALRRRWR